MFESLERAKTEIRMKTPAKIAALGAGLALASLFSLPPAQAGESTGCWRNLGCVGDGYAPPPPRYGYAPHRPSPGYYGYGGAAYGGDCYFVRRRFVDDWGRVGVRRIRVCE
jgi:hypothetical protein